MRRSLNFTPLVEFESKDVISQAINQAGEMEGSLAHELTKIFHQHISADPELKSIVDNALIQFKDTHSYSMSTAEYSEEKTALIQNLLSDYPEAQQFRQMHCRGIGSKLLERQKFIPVTVAMTKHVLSKMNPQDLHKVAALTDEALKVLSDDIMKKPNYAKMLRVTDFKETGQNKQFTFQNHLLKKIEKIKKMLQSKKVSSQAKALVALDELTNNSIEWLHQIIPSITEMLEYFQAKIYFELSSLKKGEPTLTYPPYIPSNTVYCEALFKHRSEILQQFIDNEKMKPDFDKNISRLLFKFLINAKDQGELDVELKRYLKNPDTKFLLPDTVVIDLNQLSKLAPLSTKKTAKVYFKFETTLKSESSLKELYEKEKLNLDAAPKEAFRDGFMIAKKFPDFKYEHDRAIANCDFFKKGFDAASSNTAATWESAWNALQAKFKKDKENDREYKAELKSVRESTEFKQFFEDLQKEDKEITEDKVLQNYFEKHPELRPKGYKSKVMEAKQATLFAPASKRSTMRLSQRMNSTKR